MCRIGQLPNVAGRRPSSLCLSPTMPDLFEQLDSLVPAREKLYRSMCDVKFPPVSVCSNCKTKDGHLKPGVQCELTHNPESRAKRTTCNRCKELGIKCDAIFIGVDQMLYMLCRYFRNFSTSTPELAALPSLPEGREYVTLANGATVVVDLNRSRIYEPGEYREHIENAG